MDFADTNTSLAMIYFNSTTATAENLTTTARFLQSARDDGAGGPFAILIVVCILFCLIWTPMLFHRRCQRSLTFCCRLRRQRNQTERGEVIRLSLQNLRSGDNNNHNGITNHVTTNNINNNFNSNSIFSGMNSDLHTNSAISSFFPFPTALGTGPGRPSYSSSRWSNFRHLSTEDRRSYIRNVLVSKKIIKLVKVDMPEASTDEVVEEVAEGASSEDSAAAKLEEGLATTVKAEEDGKNEANGKDVEPWEDASTRITMTLADVADSRNTTTFVTYGPCAICLTEYEEGDVLCWSQNPKCKHCFHRDCMEEWLLRHQECPCCRTNYLGLDGEDDEYDVDDDILLGSGLGLGRDIYGDDDDDDGDDDDPSDYFSRYLRTRHGQAFADDGDSSDESNALRRGVQLFYLLSRLQSIADTRPNTTFRLEGVELANGRRGSLEVQRANAENTIGMIGNRGLNVRVTDDEETGGGSTSADGSRRTRTTAVDSNISSSNRNILGESNRSIRSNRSTMNRSNRSTGSSRGAAAAAGREGRDNDHDEESGTSVAPAPFYSRFSRRGESSGSSGSSRRRGRRPADTTPATAAAATTDAATSTTISTAADEPTQDEQQDSQTSSSPAPAPTPTTVETTAPEAEQNESQVEPESRQPPEQEQQDQQEQQLQEPQEQQQQEPQEQE